MMEFITRKEAEELCLNLLFRNKSPPKDTEKRIAQDRIAVLSHSQLEWEIQDLGHSRDLYIHDYSPAKRETPNGIFCPQAYN